jgi:hypothetical protein
MWSGLQAKLLEEEEIEQEIEQILHHFLVVWCDRDPALYDWLMSWFGNTFSKPQHKNGVAIILNSPEKQIGKSRPIDSFLIPFVFGRQYAMSVSGLTSLTDRFNKQLMNKLLISCEELSVTNDSFHHTFDILKDRITGPTIKIEIKCGPSFIHLDYSNYIFVTNHDFTVKIEHGDARYIALKCNPCYKNNTSYFDRLMAGFTQRAADCFLTYCHNYKRKVYIRNIPTTQLKRDMVIAGMQSGQRFLLSFSLDGEDSEIKGAEFYNMFLAWCAKNGEKSDSNTKFGRDIKNHIKKRKSNGVMLYDLKSIKFEL